MGRTIASNLIHSVERRTARWILLYHDRLERDEITMTHEELGNTLGVRQASITSALHVLEGENAIRGYRGRIIVRDRAALVAFAGGTYGFAEAEYRRLIG
jgi:CRP-like cAMP-binding protein